MTEKRLNTELIACFHIIIYKDLTDKLRYLKKLIHVVKQVYCLLSMHLMHSRFDRLCSAPPKKVSFLPHCNPFLCMYNCF